MSMRISMRAYVCVNVKKQVSYCDISSNTQMSIKSLSSLFPSSYPISSAATHVCMCKCLRIKFLLSIL